MSRHLAQTLALALPLLQLGLTSCFFQNFQQLIQHSFHFASLFTIGLVMFPTCPLLLGYLFIFAHALGTLPQLHWNHLGTAHTIYRFIELTKTERESQQEAPQPAPEVPGTRTSSSLAPFFDLSPEEQKLIMEMRKKGSIRQESPEKKHKSEPEVPLTDTTECAHFFEAIAARDIEFGDLDPNHQQKLKTTPAARDDSLKLSIMHITMTQRMAPQEARPLQEEIQQGPIS